MTCCRSLVCTIVGAQSRHKVVMIAGEMLDIESSSPGFGVDIDVIVIIEAII